MSQKILLVEDEAVLALAESRMLERYGYEVVCAYTGEKAVETADSDAEISLILMDIDLGRGIDGTEASRRILSRHELPIVFLTSHAEKEFVDSVKKISGYGYVLKNSGEFVLIESINMAYKLFESYRDLKRKEEQLSLAMDAEDHGYWDWNMDTGDTYFSPRYYTMLDYEPGELPMHISTWESLLHPEDRDKVTAEVRDRVAQAEPFEVEFRLRTKGGSYKWIKGRGKTYQFGEHGQAHRVVGTHEDVDEKKRTEEKLKKSETRFRLIFDNAPIGIALVDERGRTFMSNPALRRFLGYSREELAEKSFSEFTHSEDLERDAANYQRLYRNEIDSYQLDKRYITKDGSTLWGNLTVSGVKDSAGRLLFAVGMVNDIAQRKVSEEQNRFYAQLLDSVGQGIIAADLEEHITYFNGFAEGLYGWSSAEVQGENTFELIFPEMEARQRRALMEAISGKGSWSGEVSARRKDGRRFSAHVKASAVEDEEGQLLGFVITCQDVTDYEQQEGLRRRNQDFINLAENASDMVARFDLDFRHLYVNKAVEYHGGRDRSELIGKTPLETGMPEKQARFAVDSLRAAVETLEEQRVEQEFPAPTELQWVETRIVPELDREGRLESLLAISRDVTEHKKTERALRESEKQTKRILDSINDGIVVLDTDLRVVRTNGKLRRDVGAESEEQLLGEKCYAAFYGFDSPCRWCPSKKVLETGEECWTTVPFPAENPQRWFHLLASPVYDDEGRIIQVVESARDITSRMEAEREKDDLMRELNHRVKNNLQMISSLVRLKNSTLGQEVDLSDIDRQITAIRLIHEKLDNTDNVSRMNIKEYVEEILDAVFTFHPETVETSVDIEPISLDTKKAVSLGLLVNEVATNAVKHGFAPGQKARFTLGMSEDRKSGEYLLSMSNTGRALPEEVDFSNPRSLGLQLIHTLAGQLGGAVELERSPGTSIHLRFPLPS